MQAEKQQYSEYEMRNWPFLDAYFADCDDSGRWSSRDICDNMREMVSLSISEVTGYMKEHGYRMQRDDDRIVWVKEEEKKDD